MSIWTSKGQIPAAVLIVAALALAGCVATEGGVTAAAGPDAPAAVRGPLAVAGGAVVIAEPRGWCIDRDASHDTSLGAFVILRGCGGAGPFGVKVAPGGLLTASVSAGPTAGDLDGADQRLAAFFSSQAGRAALSRSGRASTVKVLETVRAEGAVMIRAEDTSPFPGGGVAPDYWRAIFALDGHLVTLSAIGPAEPALDRDQGLALLRSFVASVRRATKGS